MISFSDDFGGGNSCKDIKEWPVRSLRQFSIDTKVP